jgi:Ca2+-binding EF-hand superfamily protein
MDEAGQGWVTFRQFACALSTVFRGDQGDVLEFWFRMYDTDRCAFIYKGGGAYAVVLVGGGVLVGGE